MGSYRKQAAGWLDSCLWAAYIGNIVSRRGICHLFGEDGEQ